MKIKIKGNAHELYRAYVNTGQEPSYNDKWYEMLRAIAGRTLVVETDYLFVDQFNTASIPGVSENGMRIHSRYVDEVIDDEREFKMKCSHCGKMAEVWTVTSLKCPHCLKRDALSALSESAKISFNYQLRAKAERKAGGKCEVNQNLPYISIDLSDGSEYFVQGEEAENMLYEYEDMEWVSCSIEDYFLAIAQNW